MRKTVHQMYMIQLQMQQILLKNPLSHLKDLLTFFWENGLVSLELFVRIKHGTWPVSLLFFPRQAHFKKVLHILVKIHWQHSYFNLFECFLNQRIFITADCI